MTQNEWLKKVERTIYEAVRAMGEVHDLGIDKAALAAAAAALEPAVREAAALLARIRKGELGLETAAGSAQSSSPDAPDGAASLPSDPQPSALCKAAGGCRCGGDTAGVRAGCSHWKG